MKQNVLKINKIPAVVKDGNFKIKIPAVAEAMAGKVELQGIEPWSKHIRRKLSTCLLVH